MKDVIVVEGREGLRLPVMHLFALGLLGCFGPGLIFAQSAAAPYTTGYRYDIGRRLVGLISPDPDGNGPLGYAAKRNTYDAQGYLVRVEKGQLSAWQSELIAPSAWSGFTVFQQLDYTYDPWGRRLTETTSGVASGAATPQTLIQTSYDDMGRSQCIAIRMNTANFAALPGSACTLSTPQGAFDADRITQTAYDVLSRPSQITKALGTSVAYNYVTYSHTANGKLQSVIDANGNKTFYTFDGFDRASQTNFPSPTTAGSYSTTDYEQYGYDANSNRTSLRKRDGSIIGYHFDALNRLVLKDIPGGTTKDVYYSYDLRGLQTAAIFGVSSTTCTSTTPGICASYDGFSRVSSSLNTSDGVSRSLSYQYDADGNRLKITHPDSASFTYGYDGLDRIQFICETTSPCTASASPMVTLTYDNQGRSATISRAGGAAVTSYVFDPISRLQTLNINLDGAGTANDVSYGFSYSPAGQIATRSISNGIYSNVNGAHAQTLYTPNGLNQYRTISGTSTITPTYDANANMTGDGNATYGYDVENRMVSATGGRTANLTYDPDGRLLIINGGTTASETHFLYDGDALVAEYDASGTLQHRYIHGSGSDEPLVSYDGTSVNASSRYYTFADHQGSIVAFTNSAGATTRTNTYDAYGTPGAGNGGRFQYTGQLWLPQLALYYYKARMYSPLLGRFMQTDPIGYDDDVNLYAYVGNDPLDKTDPTGRWCIFGFIGTTCTPDPPPPPQTQPTPSNQPSIWRKLIDKAGSFFKPAELQKEDKPAETPANSRDAELKKLKDLAKDKAKDLLKDAAKEAARKAGATDAQICEAEHCAAAGARMSVCLMTYCGEELGLGGNDPVDNKRQP